MKKNKIILLVGDHPRNTYVMNKLISYFSINGIILEKRTKMLPRPKSTFSQKDKIYFKKHFELREKEENKFFKINKQHQFTIDIPTLKIKKNSINSNIVKNFLKKKKPDIVISCGIGFLRKNILKILPKFSINMHTGLTPRYKGDACNFWPMFFLEPNNIGVTLHLISKDVDSGPILHQVSATKIEKNDNCHSLSCKAIIKATKDLIKILAFLNVNKNIKVIEKRFGRFFFKTDFKIEHLRAVYDKNIVSMYLKKKIHPKKIKLVNFFDLNKLK